MGHGCHVGDPLQLLAGWQLRWLLLLVSIGLHLRCGQHLPQEGLQLGVHLRQRLLQRGRLNALAGCALVLVCHLYGRKDVNALKRYGRCGHRSDLNRLFYISPAQEDTNRLLTCWH